MKQYLKIAFITFGWVLLFKNVQSQDLLKTNPKETQLLQDTAGVRVLLISVPPGGTLNNHTHPGFIAYIIEGGTLEEAFPDGTKYNAELSTGMNMKSGPMGVHADKNIGNTTVKILLMELPQKM